MDMAPDYAIAQPRAARARFSLDEADFLGALLVAPATARRRRLLDDERWLGRLLLAPAVLYILLLVGVPFFLALYYSVSAYNMGTLSFSFVGLQNFIDVTKSAIFRQALFNTFVFTFASNLIALVLGKITALILALFFIFITVVYNYSFARLIFVSGLDERLPAVMSHVNRNKVPDVAVWVQTIIAALFTLVAFIIVPSRSASSRAKRKRLPCGRAIA